METDDIQTVLPIPIQPTVSPIFSLNDDILRMIFQSNVRVESTVPLYVYVDKMNRPLTTARLSSQVCRSWRSLLLDSPSIWGKLIQLDSLDQRSGHWREEILRRSGSSPLWISGNVPGSSEDPTPVRLYLYSLLKNANSWERIERLNIIVYGSAISDSIWNAFLLPAPNLQIFEAYFPQTSSPLFQDVIPPKSDKWLFGNHAPLLYEFHAEGIAFAMDSAWLSNLHDITIPSRLTAPEILDLLVHVPLLQRVDLQPSTTTEKWLTNSILPRVDLPELSCMLLTNNLATCSTLLEHVYPAKSCSLSLSADVSYENGIISKNAQRSLKQHLPRYLNSYFSAYKSTRIRLRFYDRMFHFEDESQRHINNALFGFTVYTKPDLESRLENTELMNSLLQLFSKYLHDSPSQFSSVTELSLDMRYAETSSLAHFRSLLFSLPSVQHLRTNEDSIVFLILLSELQQAANTSDGSGSIVFPHLKVLQMSYLNPDHYLESNTTPGSLLPYLKYRKDSGYPIDTLDLQLCRSSTLRDIDFLEEIEGLQVLTNIAGVESSYICGGGMPEELRFRT